MLELPVREGDEELARDYSAFCQTQAQSAGAREVAAMGIRSEYPEIAF